ncbi:hypothetical protein GDO81_022786 [Engystomops pustulosus]|uniref:Uncharacterized protein n=1 Tax=Engystomops pustulosus TaxID=76066 RepID=A0AAV6YNY7_ENGPU|nr:hypothetical protein GDO81_022786 [Engystomops pustulosus]
MATGYSWPTARAGRQGERRTQQGKQKTRRPLAMEKSVSSITDVVYRAIPPRSAKASEEPAVVIIHIFLRFLYKQLLYRHIGMVV